jgi:hypothetical protein
MGNQLNYLLAIIIVILILFAVSSSAIMPETFYSSGASMRQSVDVDTSTMRGQNIGDFNDNELQYYISHTP